MDYNHNEALNEYIRNGMTPEEAGKAVEADRHESVREMFATRQTVEVKGKQLHPAHGRKRYIKKKNASRPKPSPPRKKKSKRKMAKASRRGNRK